VREYYLITKAHEAIWPRGVMLFWAKDERGYSTSLELAGRYDEERAEAICKFSPDTWMVPCEALEAKAIRVVDYDLYHIFTKEEYKRGVR
jgi:hypothetical protein